MFPGALGQSGSLGKAEVGLVRMAVQSLVVVPRSEVVEAGVGEEVGNWDSSTVLVVLQKVEVVDIPCANLGR